MDSEGTKPLLTPGPAVVQRPPPLRLETIIERKESADTDVTESYHPPPAVVLPGKPQCDLCVVVGALLCDLWLLVWGQWGGAVSA